jgi:hypothetical protein
VLLAGFAAELAGHRRPRGDCFDQLFGELDAAAEVLGARSALVGFQVALEPLSPVAV